MDVTASSASKPKQPVEARRASAELGEDAIQTVRGKHLRSRGACSSSRSLAVRQSRAPSLNGACRERTAWCSVKGANQPTALATFARSWCRFHPAENVALVQIPAFPRSNALGGPGALTETCRESPSRTGMDGRLRESLSVAPPNSPGFSTIRAAMSTPRRQ